ncbi:TonB-dependent receptor domain-containing protein [Rufibacter roseus]|uniref:TonB-dependent receptor domain-containing protein n=1 Tax=Rufibacter roseus TaxID=1567108 RepID=A0ABW2DQV4_9BACT|nr:TonB-dependent receptor [Rufibacter roseus]
MKLFFPTLYFSIFLFFCNSFAFAQNRVQGKVSGRLLDATTKAPLGYATAVLLTGPDSTIVASAMVDGDGSFVLQPVGEGRYTLRLSLVGFASKLMPNVRVSAAVPNVNLGSVTMGAASTQLKAVEIVGERAQIEYGLDRRVYNVGQDLSSVGGTAVDVMQNVPSVTVDQEGGVSMRGTSNITILIDGKPSALTSMGLEQIPASTIERIEVITNPSSKYDPSGTGGVLNIILKKEKQQGLNGVVSANAGMGGRYNASANLNYRIGRLNLFGNYDFRHDFRQGEGSSFRTIFRESGNIYQEQQSVSKRTFGNQNFRFGADYQLSETQSLTGSVLYRLGYREGEGNTFYRFLNTDRSLDSTSTRTSTGFEDRNLWEYALNYRKTFARQGQELTADVVYNEEREPGEDVFEQYFFNSEGGPSTTMLPLLQRNNALEQEREFSIQADYVHPFSEKGKWEAGYRTTFEREDADISATDFNHATGVFENNIGRTNHFIYDEWVHAVYGNYGNAFKSFSYQIGARVEQTEIIADQRTQKLRNRNSYLNVFPSLFLTHEFSEEQKLQFSYSRRIDRPGSRQLNPFRDISDVYNIRQGNPNLSPEFIDSYELNYLRFWDHTTATASVFYRQMSDVVQSIQQLLEGEGEEQVTFTTYQNLARGESYGLELTTGATLTPWWKINANASAFKYTIYGGEAGLGNNSRFSWTSRLNSNFNLPYKTDVQLSMNYRSPVVTVQGERSAFYMASLSARKEVLKGKGNIILRVQDLFNTMRWDSYTFGGSPENRTFEQTSRYKPQSRIVFVGFSYRFGNNNKAERREQNREGGSDAGIPDREVGGGEN